MIHRIAALLTFALTTTLTLASTPRIFHEGGYESAKAEAAESGKMLLVDFTAVWCGPCKRMDKDTWTDTGVEEWLREHTVSVQVDVDEEKEIAQRYKVRAMPTVIVVKNGKEFDRKTGYQSPDQLLGWVRDVRDGKASRGIVVDKLESGELSGPELVDAKMDFARMELDAGRYGSATEQYVWLWENMLEHNPNMVGVRSSFMLGDIQRLAKAHPPAKEKFEEMRARAFEEAVSRKSLTSLGDWATLSIEFGKTEEVLAWYDEHKGEPKYAGAVERLSFVLDRVFKEHGRWVDYGRSLSNPTWRVNHRLDSLGQTYGVEIPESARESFHSMMRKQTSEMVTSFHTALLAADREPDAFLVAGAFIEKFGDANEAKLALVTHALNAGYPHKKHLEWAQEAGDDALKRRVLGALNAASDNDENPMK